MAGWSVWIGECWCYAGFFVIKCHPNFGGIKQCKCNLLMDFTPKKVHCLVILMLTSDLGMPFGVVRKFHTDKVLGVCFSSVHLRQSLYHFALPLHIHIFL